MAGRLIDRKAEMEFLTGEYKRERASFVVVYGRRRMGKTTLLRHFIADKPALYFLATEEPDAENRKSFQQLAAEFTESPLLAGGSGFSWEDMLLTVVSDTSTSKVVVVIDELPYLVRSAPAFPSILQRVWDRHLQHRNVMLVLCGSHIGMMETHALAYSSPLYGRRTGQLKLGPIAFMHYAEFHPELSARDAVPYYAVTGGVPKYIEHVAPERNVMEAVERHVLDRRSFLFEEPVFLLESEVDHIGSYFSLLKTIAAGNRKLGRMATVLGVPQTKLTSYLRTLTDLEIIERRVPVTEDQPAKSRKGLYFIRDHFLAFWFRYVYSHKASLEMEALGPVRRLLEEDFVSGHVAFVYEDVCGQQLWQMAKQGVLPFVPERLGHWWDKGAEIDWVGLAEAESAALFCECKYSSSPVDVPVFVHLKEKSALVDWRRGERRDYYLLFSRAGFTPRLSALAKERGDLILAGRYIV